MTDDIDRIIEAATGKSLERAREVRMPWSLADLRAVAEAAYRRGYESASLAHGNSDAIVRQAERRAIRDALRDAAVNALLKWPPSAVDSEEIDRWFQKGGRFEVEEDE